MTGATLSDLVAMAVQEVRDARRQSRVRALARLLDTEVAAADRQREATSPARESGYPDTTDENSSGNTTT
jgi:hypothetical protein